MGTKERRAREKQDTRERILASAREMFARDGVEAVTMRAIAQRIEYTPTAIYHHFPSKQALLTELCERDFSGLAQHFVAAAGRHDPIDRLQAVGEAYLEFAERYPSQYRFMFMTKLPELAHGEQFVQEQMESPEKNAYLFLRQACVQAIESGRIRPECSDPDLIAQVLWGSIHGQISLRITKHHQDFVPWKELREAVHFTMSALMQGMLRPV